MLLLAEDSEGLKHQEYYRGYRDAEEEGELLDTENTEDTVF